MDSIFGLCCVNRQKDDLNSSDVMNVSKPVDFIRSRPGLVRVLKWFEEIEDTFRDSMFEVRESLETIIEVLDGQCDEELIELREGQEVAVKVVDKRAVADVLQFGSRDARAVQEVLEKIEFFQVESTSNEQVDQYDFNKLILFCLLFCEETPANKATCLFYLMCDDKNLITNKNGQVKTMIAMLTLISCMIPAEMIKIGKLKSVGFEDMQEFEQLYASYCCQPQVFNKFTTYLKNSKLFVSMRGPLNLHAFRNLMFEQDFIFVDSAMIRHEYTYFVCFQMLPEHAKYFNRPSFQSQGTNMDMSYRETYKSIQQEQFKMKGGDRRRDSRRDAQSDLTSEASYNRRKPKQGKAMQAARNSVNQYENDLESMASHKQGKKKPTKGQPLQDKGNRYSIPQSEDSIAYNQNQRESLLIKHMGNKQDVRLDSIDESEDLSDEDQRPKKKAKTKGKKGKPVKKVVKQLSSSSDSASDSDSSDIDSSQQDTEYGNNRGLNKDEIDIFADDTVPVKKEKKTKKQQRQSESSAGMEFDDNVAVKKSKKAAKDVPKAALNESKMSFRSAFDRGSVKSTVSRKRQQTIEEYISGQVGIQFYDLVFQLSSEQQAEYAVDYQIKNSNSGSDRKAMIKRDKRFNQNRSMLLDPEGFEMPFPETVDQYPGHIREVFQFLQKAVTAGDLVALQEGETCEESLINVYFKILEKINFVLLKANDYLKQQQTAGSAGQQPITAVATQKVLFCNTNFIRDLKLCAPNDYDLLKNGPETDQKRKYEKIIKDITENEVVLIPFYPEATQESEFEQTPMLVELRPKKYQATLYMKAGDRITTTTAGGETPNPTEQTADMISEEVMKIFTNCAKFYGDEFDIEDVDGGTCEVCVNCEEDYMVAMAYVADCHTYKRDVNLEKFSVERERNKMIDLYLALLNFQ